MPSNRPTKPLISIRTARMVRTASKFIMLRTPRRPTKAFQPCVEKATWNCARAEPSSYPKDLASGWLSPEWLTLGGASDADVAAPVFTSIIFFATVPLKSVKENHACRDIQSGTASSTRRAPQTPSVARFSRASLKKSRWLPALVAVTQMAIRDSEQSSRRLRVSTCLLKTSSGLFKKELASCLDRATRTLPTKALVPAEWQ